MKLVMMFFLYACNLLAAQNLESLIEKVYRQDMVQDSLLRALQDYSYRQQIEFKKFDSDDEIDQQSRTEFDVFARGSELRKRVLVRSEIFEDGKWQDVTDEKKSGKEEGQSKKFSLSEMVSPKNRIKYRFTFIGSETLGDTPVEHIKVEPLEANEDRFSGDLWIHANEFVVKKASLVPSEFPTGLRFMQMDFLMDKFDRVWLPVRIDLKADISFLLIFSGRIYSVILFENYTFGQNFGKQFFSEN